MPDVWFPNLGIEIENMSRVAFTLFGMDIYWYGVCIAAGVIGGILLAMRLAKALGQDPEIYLDISLYTVAFAIFGARLYYILFSWEWEYYMNDPLKIFALREGGIAIYGGILAGALTVWIYSKRKKMSFYMLADTMAPCLILGQIIGRIGNFLNREVFGGYTNNLFAMRYPLADVRAGDLTEEILNNLYNLNGVNYIQVHPTFLYEILWNIGVLLILLFFIKKKSFDGQIMAIYFLGYGIGRFWIEGVRTDQLLIGGLPVSQLLSAFLVAGAVLFMVWKRKTASNTKS